MVGVVDDWGVCYRPTTGRVDDEGERKAFPLILIEPNRVIPNPSDGEDVAEVFDDPLRARYPIQRCYSTYHPHMLNVHFPTIALR